MSKVWMLRAAWLLNLVFVTSVALADAGLRPGDQIELKLGGVPTTESTSVSGSYTLDSAGSVNLPYIGRIKIGGLAPGAAQSTIEGVYKARAIYTNPAIVITMLEKSRFVNVGGEVKTPNGFLLRQISRFFPRSAPLADFPHLPISAKCDCFGGTRSRSST